MSEEDRRTLPPMAMLHSFAAAARHGSFSRAAAEVGLTQSAISRQIAHLEEWLGVSLFDRTGRRVSLNEAGRAYAEEVEAALGAIRRATADCDSMDRNSVNTMCSSSTPRMPSAPASSPSSSTPDMNADTSVSAISRAFSYVGRSENPVHDSTTSRLRKLK